MKEKDEWREEFIRIMHQRFGVDLQTCGMEHEAYTDLNLEGYTEPSEAVNECAENWCNSMQNLKPYF